MPETISNPPQESKSPKTPRRLKTQADPLQVRFASEPAATGTKNVNGSTKETASESQPTHFPQVGVAPGSNGGVQWHTSANPTQSLSTAVGGQPFATGGIPFPQQQQQQYYQQQQHFCPPHHHQHPPHFSAPAPPFVLPSPQPNQVTYIGVNNQPPCAASMADYQNCAPPSTGVHFQPPVPDTTFGPIPHVYVPRFDGGLVSGVQVGPPPSVQFVSAPACTSTTTVVMPKTFYLNGYTYYASGPIVALLHSLSSLCRQPAVGSIAPQPCQPGLVIAQQPYLVQQPVMGQQPVMLGSQPQMAPPVQHVPGVPTVGVAGGAAAMSGGIPVIAGNTPGHHVPEVSGIGRTAGEEQLRQVQFAHANRLYEPQDFKPADDDPSRFYFVREVDGNWTQRNRFTIDHMGDCRWYVTDEGWFYAVRLPD